MTRSGKDNRFSRSPGGVALVWVSKKGVLPIIGPRTGAQRRQSRRAGEPPNNFAVSTRRARFRWAFLTICFPMLPCKTGSPAENSNNSSIRGQRLRISGITSVFPPG